MTDSLLPTATDAQLEEARDYWRERAMIARRFAESELGEEDLRSAWRDELCAECIEIVRSIRKLVAIEAAISEVSARLPEGEDA